MNCRYCLGENPEEARFCSTCGKGLRPEDERSTDPRGCISCGKIMDQEVYFTMCPHCGFNYRIEVFPSDGKEKLTARSLVPSFLAGALIVCATLLLLLLIG
ncbi:MAG: zinc ribbon domain-containing protein [Candidatus Thermoplasmatota archaeon]|nr:zinc ribbon domain-containing protein [Candidatus Thermoplasmatota archaeon]